MKLFNIKMGFYRLLYEFIFTISIMIIMGCQGAENKQDYHFIKPKNTPIGGELVSNELGQFNREDEDELEEETQILDHQPPNNSELNIISDTNKLRIDNTNLTNKGSWALEDKPVNLFTTASGLVIIDNIVGDGDIPEAGDVVEVHYHGKLENGSQIDNTYEKEKPIQFKLGNDKVIKGWDEGVATMRKGGQRRLIIPPELGYGSKGAGNLIPPNATLIFDVELINIKKAQSTVNTTAPIRKIIKNSGLQMTVKKEGAGTFPINGQTLVVHYTGKLENGTQFDSSYDRGKPFVFTLGSGKVIQAWQEAFAEMKKGEIRILKVPPYLGYGDKSVGKVPRNATLIFEVELLDFF